MQSNATTVTNRSSFMMHDGLIGLRGAKRIITHQNAGARFRDRRLGGSARTRLPGRRHRQHLEAHLEAGLRLPGLAFDQQLVVAEADQGLVRELALFQVAQRRAVDGEPTPPAQILDREQRVGAARRAVRVESQLPARHARVEYRERARTAVAPQRERLFSGALDPGAQGKQPVEVPVALLGVVDLHVEAGKQILLGLHCLGDAHGRA